jgi:hypothetical protein
MGDQKNQRLNLVSQSADACKRFLAAYNDLVALMDRAPFLGTLTDPELQGTALAYLDAATVTEFFTQVVPSLRTNYLDTGNSGRNRRVLNQMTESV